MKAYIAGPLWKEENRNKLEEIDVICKELSIDTFLPHRDVGIYHGKDSKKFFKGDSEFLDECDLVIALLDWKSVGSGTAWEIGYAYAKKIPVIGLVEDIDSLEMPERTCVMVFNSVELVDSLKKLKERLESSCS
jgi:nucleoside 2-deoxyribosyltransferase